MRAVTTQELKKTLKATVEKLSPLDPLVKEAVDDVRVEEGQHQSQHGRK